MWRILAAPFGIVNGKSKQLAGIMVNFVIINWLMGLMLLY